MELMVEVEMESNRLKCSFLILDLEPISSAALKPPAIRAFLISDGLAIEQ